MNQDNIQFVSYPLKNIYPEKPLPADLYLFVGGKFLKFKNQEDFISNEKFELFLYKRLQFVFVAEHDLDKFKNWSKSFETHVKEELIENVGEENKDIVEKRNEVHEAYLSFIYKEVTEESVKEMLDKTRDFISAVKSKKAAEKFLTQLMRYDQSAVDHSQNVANLATFIALNIGYSQQLILENIYVGALLHDFGKTKISPKYLDDPTSATYKTAMRKHPALGKTALMIDSGFSDEALRIIGEHHERFDGKGYPDGKKGARIYDLSKIVSIANVFDNLVRKQEKEPDYLKRQRNALKEIEKDNGKMFDPKILAKTIKVLETIC